MIWLIPGLLIGMAFGFFLAGLLMAAGKPEPDDTETISTAYVTGYLHGARDRQATR